MRVLWIASAQVLIVAAILLAYFLAPKTLELPRPYISQSLELVQDMPVIRWPGRSLLGQLYEGDDLLPAYLFFDWLRSQRQLKGDPLLFTVKRLDNRPVYRILVLLPADLIAGVTRLNELKQVHLASEVKWDWALLADLHDVQQSTRLFTQVLEESSGQGINAMPQVDLQRYVAEFIRFKSLTDPRIWEQESDLRPLDEDRADMLAADMICVANFYDIPIELLIGIGAMENNFLSAPGDLDNAVWKIRAERDDIVLRRERTRVWVLNSSIGIWQITRQALRHAQELYLQDDRDYSSLAESLRPSETLDIEALNRRVLTTYAGLLLRDLLDHFAGDVNLALGAYNGTIERPNLKYAAGVEIVSTYAKNMIASAADITRRAEAQGELVRTPSQR